MFSYRKDGDCGDRFVVGEVVVVVAVGGGFSVAGGSAGTVLL